MPLQPYDHLAPPAYDDRQRAVDSGRDWIFCAVKGFRKAAGPNRFRRPVEQAHDLKQRARERAERTVERMKAGIAALQASGRKITAASIKEVTRDLEPGFAGLSFQVIRRNARAYALYREAADAFSAIATAAGKQRTRRRRRTRSRGREPRSSYDPLQRLDKRDLVLRIRKLECELDAERHQRAALAYDQQAVRAKLLRAETEIILLHAERSAPE